MFFWLLPVGLVLGGKSVAPVLRTGLYAGVGKLIMSQARALLRRGGTTLGMHLVRMAVGLPCSGRLRPAVD